MKTVYCTAICKISLDEDAITSAMEGDGETRSEAEAILALALEAFHPAENIDVGELEIHPSK